MENNLIICYDLYKQGQDYPAVKKAIESLGKAIKIQQSVFYVKSKYSSEQAYDIVRKSTDQNDFLLIVNASKNGFRSYLPHDITRFIESNW